MSRQMKKSNFDIRIRLLLLGKNQRHLREELDKRGFQVTAPRLSAYIRGVESNKYADVVVEKSKEIIKEWEEERNES